MSAATHLRLQLQSKLQYYSKIATWIHLRHRSRLDLQMNMDESQRHKAAS
jgi:23S rRNA maturation-related 3'-5' exoribonuclease YhaM